MPLLLQTHETNRLNNQFLTSHGQETSCGSPCLFGSATSAHGSATTAATQPTHPALLLLLLPLMLQSPGDYPARLLLLMQMLTMTRMICYCHFLLRLHCCC
jgi:hypothetical protein